ncbi:hypothetical protein Lo5R7ANS_02 [Mesorhizobium phage vB_MloP_Lo5R7ANS]|uniref:Gene product 88 domain-containing protein n=1 Tax=Mesorhizobium phage vB_MloP_Lo5R7ANS TaxID=1527771 RepID=A0A076YL19_9CAUD|nr:hypothetical protein Lo5R7ANS_02 [Mesorhizobium phage vB_MloP_Lo5R7ANS]AIK68472.1 hypothetical protein Lo5R7ANS_02 [Mesorhizobium phage vB_MloP_Lo5R7ANS]
MCKHQHQREVLTMYRGTLIRSGGNAKTIKGDKAGEYETAIMYLAPASQSLMGNVCPMAIMAGCEKACLFKAGRAGIFEAIPAARIAKTQRYFSDRVAFMAELHRDIAAFVRYCNRKGVKPAVRLNGTSDIQWEVGHPVAGFKSIFEAFPMVQFYDYTKITKRAYRALPANYALTLSYSEANPAYAAAVIKAACETGLNMAVVYRSKAIRDNMLYSGDAFGDASNGVVSTTRVIRQVIDGDETDMRFSDPRGVIVGLYAKGPAKRDTSGFVVG